MSEQPNGPPDGRQAPDGDTEAVRAPFRGAEAPQRDKKSFAWLGVIVVVALMVGALLVALGVGLLD